MSVNEDGDDSLPTSLSEVGHTVINVELDDLVANPTTDRDHLTRHVAGLSSLHRWFFLIVAILQKALDVGKGKIACGKHTGNDYHRVRLITKLVVSGISMLVALGDSLKEIKALLRPHYLHIQIDFFCDGPSLFDSRLNLVNVI